MEIKKKLKKSKIKTKVYSKKYLMQEIERKFLILTPPPKDKNRITEEIRQGYFIQENQQIRIRKSIITKNKRKTTKYTQTQKKGS